MRRLTCALALSLTFVAAPRIADACSCMKSPSAAAAAKEAAAVFEGKVVSSEEFEKSLNGGDYKMKARRYKVEVTRTWKGMAAAGSVIMVETADNSAACGRTYELNTSYLFYANASDTEGHLHDGLCSRTTKSEAAKEDFEALGPADGKWEAPADTGDAGGDDAGDAPTEPSADNPFDRPPAEGEADPDAAGADAGEADPPKGSAPPPSEPSSRGCSIDANSVTNNGYGGPLGLALGLGLLGLARRRRTSERSTP